MGSLEAKNIIMIKNHRFDRGRRPLVMNVLILLGISAFQYLILILFNYLIQVLQLLLHGHFYGRHHSCGTKVYLVSVGGLGNSSLSHVRIDRGFSG